MQITIPKILEKDINEFVKLNNIEDINLFIISCLRTGFNISKYGYSPKDNFNKENKPFKINDNDSPKEKSNSERVEKKDTSRKEKQKRQVTTEENIEQGEKVEEIVKPKKKITIIKK